ncbi:MAG: radical SAM protein [Bacteroidales bacterium]|nr:radical SAM protein [Bacteroidales bacterium]
MYKYLFGPVPSRRLGMSLGVDLVPHKVCTLDCVYCECGATTKLTVDRKEYILYDRITEELTHYFEHNPDPEYITFSGSGEPTLNSRIGDVIVFIKSKKPNIPIAVLTNGTLLNNKSLRKEIYKADVILPSLDAAVSSDFQNINRPHNSLTVDTYIQGLIDLRNEFLGKIWLEILILPGYNDNPENITALKEAILKIKPDSIQLNTLDRPGVLTDLEAASQDELLKIINSWNLKNVEIIAKVKDREKVISYREDIETAILETIKRRPCTLHDLSLLLGTHINEINKYLGVLEENGKILTKSLDRGTFYQIKK